jgi:hypothetical protein
MLKIKLFYMNVKSYIIEDEIIFNYIRDQYLIKFNLNVQ